METLAQLAILAAFVAAVLAILALRRTGELHGLEKEVERLAREGRYLRQRMRSLETPGAAEGPEPETGRTTEVDGEPEGPPSIEPPTEPPVEPPVEPAALGADEPAEASPAERARELAEVLSHRDDAAASRPAAVAPAPRRAAKKRSSLDLERLLGVRGAAMAGGLVMALAAILLFKHAFEQNWITPEMRIASGIVWGFVLVGAGSFARKRALNWVPGALEGAGLVALYASIWAADQMYGFVSAPWSFILMALVTALGCFLALRHGSLITAQVGLIGGFATPLLLHTGRPQPFGLFGYLLLLDLALLFLGRRRAWPSVGILAVLGTLLFEVLWFLAPGLVGRDGLTWSGGQHEAFGVVILGVFGLVFLAAGATGSRAGATRSRAWRLVELGGLGASGALAFYLAVESDLSGDLWPTATLAVVLTAGATFLGLKRGDLVSATAAVLFGLAMIAAWCLDREPLAGGDAWQLVGSALALAALVGLPRLRAAWAAPLATTARTAGLGVALLMLLLAVTGSWSGASPGGMVALVLGLVGASALLLGSTWGDQGGPDDREAERGASLLRGLLALSAGALTGLGLLLRSQAALAGGHPLGLGSWGLVLVLAVVLALAAVACARCPRGAGAERLQPVLGAGLGALLMLLDVELIDGLTGARDQAALRSLVSHGLAVPTLLAILALGAAAIAARLGAGAGEDRRAFPDRAFAAWLDGRVLAVLVPAGFLVQLWAWNEAVFDLGLALPGGQASRSWGTAAGGGAQGAGFAWGLVVSWLLLAAPALHARLVVGRIEGLDPWSWRFLAVVSLPMVLALGLPFVGATGLDWEREGCLLAVGLLGLLLVVAWRLVAREGEVVAEGPEGQRSALTWVGFLAAGFLAFAVADAMAELQGLTFFVVLALAQAALAWRAGRPAATWVGISALALALLALMAGLAADQGPDFGLPLLGWHTYAALAPAAVAAAMAWLSERTVHTVRATSDPMDAPDAPLNLPQGGTSPPFKRTVGSGDGDAKSWDDLVVRRVVLGATVLAMLFLWINLEISNHFDGAQFAAGNRQVVAPNLVIGDLPPRDLAMSLAWGVFALALLFLGSRRASGAIRWTSLGLVLAAITKVFLSDLAHLEGLYRVASLAGLALSLLLVSVLYQRFVFQRPLADGERAR